MMRKFRFIMDIKVLKVQKVFKRIFSTVFIFCNLHTQNTQFWFFQRKKCVFNEENPIRLIGKIQLDWWKREKRNQWMTPGHVDGAFCLIDFLIRVIKFSYEMITIMSLSDQQSFKTFKLHLSCHMNLIFRSF